MKVPRGLSEFIYWQEQQWRGRGDVKNRLDWLLQTQCLSPEEIRSIQFEKLHQIITYAYKTVPYYQNVMKERDIRPDDITTFEDLHKLPILSRDLLRTRQEELLSSEADHKTLQTNFSSGSTGLRAVFKQDANFRMWMRAHQLRTYSWCSNWKLGEPFVLLWGSEIYWNSKQFIDHLENLLSNRREFNTFRLSQKLIEQFLYKLVQFRPVLVSTYTNAMYLIAKVAEQQQIYIPELRAVQGTSEPFPPATKERISKIFNCEVYDKYGMRETNIVAHESPNHEEMCIQAENVYVEFLTDDGLPCKEGQKGRVVLTTLNNFSMPLIRYETSDLAAPVPGYCSSGFGFPRMTSVAGRLQDLIVSPNGDRIDAYLFSYLLMRFSEIHWFQVVQSELDSLALRVFAPNDITPSTREQIIERIHYHTGFPFKIDFEMLSEMPESSTGKFRLCVSELLQMQSLQGNINN
jgi:phenylacetate-CoA ligase